MPQQLQMLKPTLLLIICLGLTTYAVAVRQVQMALLFDPMAILWISAACLWGLAFLPLPASCLQRLLQGQGQAADYQALQEHIPQLYPVIFWAAITGTCLGLLPFLSDSPGPLSRVLLPSVYAALVRYGLLDGLSLYLQRHTPLP